MTATTSASANYPAVRARRHPGCWVCDPSHPSGLAVCFEVTDNGTVEGVFRCGEEYAGYPGFLHGGLIATLLDGAMTNCLLARETPGLTGRLEVRYRKPMLIVEPITIRGWWEKSRGPMHILGAQLSQNSDILATAIGHFVEYPENPRPDTEGGVDEKNRDHHL